MQFIKKHYLFFIFLLGLIIRLSIIYYDYSWDVNNHMVWAKDFLTRGPANFYEAISSNAFASLTPNYPPLAIYIFVVMRLFNPVIHDLYWWLNLHIPLVPSNLIFFLEKTVFLAGLMKIPAIISDLGIAWIILLFARRIIPKDKKKQMLGAVFILFNPAFIFNSALWGQIDSIPIFCFLLSLYFLIYTRRDILSAFILTTALLIKPTVIIFLPAYAVIFIKRFGVKKALINFVLVNIIFLISFLPFLKEKNIFLYPYQVYYGKILAAQSLSFITNGALNFWMLVSNMKNIKDTAIFSLGIPYKFAGYLITGVISYFAILPLFKNKKTDGDSFAALFIVGFASFLFLTKMHERYSLLPLSFLLLLTLKRKNLMGWFIILSLISFINHYCNWTVPRVEFFVNVMKSRLFVMSFAFLNMFIFFYLYKIIIWDKKFLESKNTRV